MRWPYLLLSWCDLLSQKVHFDCVEFKRGIVFSLTRLVLRQTLKLRRCFVSCQHYFIEQDEVVQERSLNFYQSVASVGYSNVSGMSLVNAESIVRIFDDGAATRIDKEHMACFLLCCSCRGWGKGRMVEQLVVRLVVEKFSYIWRSLSLCLSKLSLSLYDIRLTLCYVRNFFCCLNDAEVIRL